MYKFFDKKVTIYSIEYEKVDGEQVLDDLIIYDEIDCDFYYSGTSGITTTEFDIIDEKAEAIILVEPTKTGIKTGYYAKIEGYGTFIINSIYYYDERKPFYELGCNTLKG